MENDKNKDKNKEVVGCVKVCDEYFDFLSCCVWAKICLVRVVNE